MNLTERPELAQLSDSVQDGSQLVGTGFQAELFFFGSELAPIKATRAEMRVLQARVNGLTIAQIAREFGTSSKTVETQEGTLVKRNRESSAQSTKAVNTRVVFFAVRQSFLEVPSVPERISLRQRELRVLCGIVRGQAISSIAEELQISEKTVETHRRHIYLKIGARNYIQATAVIA